MLQPVGEFELSQVLRSSGRAYVAGFVFEDRNRLRSPTSVRQLCFAELPIRSTPTRFPAGTSAIIMNHRIYNHYSINQIMEWNIKKTKKKRNLLCCLTLCQCWIPAVSLLQLLYLLFPHNLNRHPRKIKNRHPSVVCRNREQLHNVLSILRIVNTKSCK